MADSKELRGEVILEIITKLPNGEELVAKYQGRIWVFFSFCVRNSFNSDLYPEIKIPDREFDGMDWFDPAIEVMGLWKTQCDELGEELPLPFDELPAQFLLILLNLKMEG